MNPKGTYCLFFEIGRIEVKTKGRAFSLEPGIYVYVGSAFGSGGLKARIERHLRKNKKLHWHIDYLSMDRSFKPLKVMVLKGRKAECQTAKVLNGNLKPVDGFGCTDCNCQSHLFKIEENRLKNTLNMLEEGYGFEDYAKQLNRRKEPIVR